MATAGARTSISDERIAAQDERRGRRVGGASSCFNFDRQTCNVPALIPDLGREVFRAQCAFPPNAEPAFATVSGYACSRHLDEPVYTAAPITSATRLTGRIPIQGRCRASSDRVKCPTSVAPAGLHPRASGAAATPSVPAARPSDWCAGAEGVAHRGAPEPRVKRSRAPDRRSGSPSARRRSARCEQKTRTQGRRS
jgi:hypothetical protein